MMKAKGGANLAVNFKSVGGDTEIFGNPRSLQVEDKIVCET